MIAPWKRKESLSGKNPSGAADARLSAFNQQVLQQQPNHAHAWQLLGMVHVVGNRPAEALPALQRALALNPRQTQILCLLGTVLARLGQSEQAIDHFRQALALAPQDANIWYDLGNVQHGLGQHLQALASHDRALALAPGHADAWLNRGHALLELHRLGDAIASFERAIDLRPRASTWLLLGSALEQAQRLPDALACFEKVVALEPDNLDGWLKFGGVLLQLGRPDLALERIEVAQRLAPQSPRVLLTQAAALAKTRGDAAALMPLLQAHALAPDDLSVSMQLLYFMLKTAHWEGLTEVLAQTLRHWRAGARDANTLTLLAHPDVSAADLLQIAQAYHAPLNDAFRAMHAKVARGAPAGRSAAPRGRLSDDRRVRSP